MNDLIYEVKRECGALVAYAGVYDLEERYKKEICSLMAMISNAVDPTLDIGARINNIDGAIIEIEKVPHIARIGEFAISALDELGVILEFKA